MMQNTMKPKQRNPIAFDTTFPFEELLMLMGPEQGKIVQALPLPEGFHLAKPSAVPPLRNQWVSVMERAGFPFSKEEAEGFFDEMITEDENYFVHHLYALLDEQNRLACVVGIWPGKHMDAGYRVHWMMTDPDFQSRGLARTVLSHAIHDYFEERPEGSLFLSTQAGSWPAIRMYEAFGFEPFLSDCNVSTRKENETRWANARKWVFDKEGVRI